LGDPGLVGHRVRDYFFDHRHICLDDER
jgi:hypothetical protein